MSLIVTDEGTVLGLKEVELHKRVENIKPMVYRISMDQDGNIFMPKDRLRFTLPDKFYGSHSTYCKMVYDKYKDRAPDCTGLIATGLKGAGKSLLSEDLCNRCIDDGLPVLLVEQPLPAFAIKKVIRAFGPCAVYFDEFGKVYSKEESRQTLLTLFSDSSLEQVLFIVTSNNIWGELSDYMVDRPGRFLFRITYETLPADTWQDMLDERTIAYPIKDYLVDYIAHHPISFDIARVVLELAEKAKNVDGFIELAKVHNIPHPVGVKFTVMEVFVDGKPFEEDVVVKADGKSLNFRLTNRADNAVVADVTVDWDKVEKTNLGVVSHFTKSDHTYRLTLADNITAKVQRNVYKLNDIHSIPTSDIQRVGGFRRRMRMEHNHHNDGPAWNDPDDGGRRF